VRYDPERQTWWVEDVSGRQDIVVNIEEPRQKVYINRVTDTVVTISGKCTAISLAESKRSAVIFDDVIATVEVVYAERIQLQANQSVPIIQLDKTHGGTIFLQTNKSLDGNIVTSQCSGLNLCTPGATPDDDMIETPVPEQFVTKYDPLKKKWYTEPSDHRSN